MDSQQNQAQIGRQRGQPAVGDRVHYEYLDGVRGMAAIFVVAHHLWRSYTVVALAGLLGLATNWLLYGHLAVDVFIVLSGFCLMLPVVRSRSLRGGWRRFYGGRARRILPPLYAAIVVAMLEFVIHHYQPPPRAIVANLLLLQDIWQRQNIFDPPLWSVAVECKIYLLFPALAWCWMRFGPRGLILTSGILSALIYGLVSQIHLVTDQGLICPWYLLLFAMGMTAADHALRDGKQRSERLTSWLLFCAVAALGVTLWAWPVTAAGENPFYVPHLPVIDTAAGVVTALVLAILGRKAAHGERCMAIRWFSWKPFVFLGSIAYSIYLIHIFVIYELRNALIYYLPFHPPWLVIALDMAAVAGVAYLFHIAVERPFMSRRPPKSGHEAESTFLHSDTVPAMPMQRAMREVQPV